MKLFMQGLLISVLVIFTSACTLCDRHEGPSYHGLMQYEYQTLEDALDHTETIVEIRKTGKVNVIVDQHVDLTLTEVQVLNTYKGDSELIGRTIQILDLMQMSMGLHEKEDHYVLFLHPKTGRLGEDIYSVIGEYQGKFKVDNENKLVYDADEFGGVKTFQEDMEQLPLLSMSSHLRQP